MCHAFFLVRFSHFSSMQVIGKCVGLFTVGLLDLSYIDDLFQEVLPVKASTLKCS
jgi:hypothetical protein